MVNSHTKASMDLESAKDKLRISLTRLETVVEERINKYKLQSDGNSSESSIDVEIKLNAANDENQQLKSEVTKLKGLNKNVAAKVDNLIEQVQTGLKNASS